MRAFHAISVAALVYDVSPEVLCQNGRIDGRTGCTHHRRMLRHDARAGSQVAEQSIGQRVKGDGWPGPRRIAAMFIVAAGGIPHPLGGAHRGNDAGRLTGLEAPS